MRWGSKYNPEEGPPAAPQPVAPVHRHRGEATLDELADSLTQSLIRAGAATNRYASDLFAQPDDGVHVPHAAVTKVKFNLKVAATGKATAPDGTEERLFIVDAAQLAKLPEHLLSSIEFEILMEPPAPE